MNRMHSLKIIKGGGCDQTVFKKIHGICCSISADFFFPVDVHFFQQGKMMGAACGQWSGASEWATPIFPTVYNPFLLPCSSVPWCRVFSSKHLYRNPALYPPVQQNKCQTNEGAGELLIFYSFIIQASSHSENTLVPRWHHEQAS